MACCLGRMYHDTIRLPVYAVPSQRQDFTRAPQATVSAQHYDCPPGRIADRKYPVNFRGRDELLPILLVDGLAAYVGKRIRFDQLVLAGHAKDLPGESQSLVNRRLQWTIRRSKQIHCWIHAIVRGAYAGQPIEWINPVGDKWR